MTETAGLAMPSRQSWAHVDSWTEESDIIREARARAEELGCPAVARPTAALLRLLAATVQAQNIVEIGTGTGVASAALLSGMTPAGVLTTIDVEAEHQRYAREVLLALGHEHTRVRLIAGRSLDVLPRLSDATYDLVFVDGDATDYPAIVQQAKRMLRIGGLLVLDHALWGGRVADPADRDGETMALRDAVGMVAADTDWIPALLSVGDGVLVAMLSSR